MIGDLLNPPIQQRLGVVFEDEEVSDRPASDVLNMTTAIVAAYVSNHTVETGDLGQMIRQVHATLEALIGQRPAASAPDLKPAVTIKRSITPDYLICLEDGKKFKSLKRHLRSQYNLSPEDYREKWGLPLDYPMVAPNYAEARSKLAKKMGLGTRREK
jgi:predicted transcriptional regulator